jgi:hypothetical protein
VLIDKRPPLSVKNKTDLLPNSASCKRWDTLEKGLWNSYPPALGGDTWHGRIAVLHYVSLGSLTSLGSGAVVPVRPPATMLTTLEAVFGQFYIAVVVAQLMGARLSQAPQRNSSPQA